MSLNRKYLAPMGAVLGALLASSCCILPLLLVMVGVGGSWIGSLSELNIYQPYFIVFAGLCLSAGFWQVYKRPVQKPDSVPECSSANSRIYTKTILWSATLLVAVNATITWWAPILY